MVKVVLTGGLTKHPSTIIKEAMHEVIAGEYGRAEIVIPRAEPVLEAVLSAMRLTGAPIGRTILRRLEDSFRRHRASTSATTNETS